jgi:hypothetical protein
VHELVVELHSTASHHAWTHLVSTHTLRAIESLTAANRLVSICSCMHSHLRGRGLNHNAVIALVAKTVPCHLRLAGFCSSLTHPL